MTEQLIFAVSWAAVSLLAVAGLLLRDWRAGSGFSVSETFTRDAALALIWPLSLVITVMWVVHIRNIS